VIGGAESSIRVLSTPGDFVTHRRIPVNDEVAEPAEPSTPVQIRAVYTRDHAKQAWARRRADLEDIAGIDNFLAEIDSRARELERRTAAVLAQTSPFETRSEGNLNPSRMP